MLTSGEIKQKLSIHIEGGRWHFWNFDGKWLNWMSPRRHWGSLKGVEQHFKNSEMYCQIQCSFDWNQSIATLIGGKLLKIVQRKKNYKILHKFFNEKLKWILSWRGTRGKLLTRSVGLTIECQKCNRGDIFKFWVSRKKGSSLPQCSLMIGHPEHRANANMLFCHVGRDTHHSFLCFFCFWFFFFIFLH